MEAVRLDRYGQFTLQGSKYGSEKLATERRPGMTFTVLFDPDHLGRPVAVLLAGEHYCDASPIGVVQFGNTEAAREHAKHKARLGKAVKVQAEARKGMARAKGQAIDEVGGTQVLPATGSAVALEGPNEAEWPALPPDAKTLDPAITEAQILADMRAMSEPKPLKRPLPLTYSD